MIPHYFQQCMTYQNLKFIKWWSKKILEWVFKWKMLFSSDITKQAQEFVFSHENTKSDQAIVFLSICCSYSMSILSGKAYTWKAKF